MASQNINMDINKNPDAASPVLEFTLPKHEIGADLKVGDLGQVVIPVEVIAFGTESITFRKAKAAKTEGSFRSESLDDMRNRMGVTDEPEK